MRLWTSILAGLQVVSGGTILLEIWDRRWVGLFILVVAAVQVGTAAYMKGPDQRHWGNKPWASAQGGNPHQAKHAVVDEEP